MITTKVLKKKRNSLSKEDVRDIAFIMRSGYENPLVERYLRVMIKMEILPKNFMGKPRKKMHSKLRRLAEQEDMIYKNPKPHLYSSRNPTPETVDPLFENVTKAYEDEVGWWETFE